MLEGVLHIVVRDIEVGRGLALLAELRLFRLGREWRREGCDFWWRRLTGRLQHV